MQSVILVLSDASQRQLLRMIELKGASRAYDVDNFRRVIEFYDGYVAFNAEDLVHEFDGEELARLPFSPALCVSAEFSNIGVIRRALLEVENTALTDAWIDDDNGTLEPLGTFCLRLREQPNWDWRA